MAVTLQVRTIVYEEREFETAAVMSVKDAAVAIGVTMQTIISAFDRGRLTELVDPDAIHPFRNRRFVLRSEVEEMAARRAKADKWGDEKGDG